MSDGRLLSLRLRPFAASQFERFKPIKIRRIDERTVCAKSKKFYFFLCMLVFSSSDSMWNWIYADDYYRHRRFVGEFVVRMHIHAKQRKSIAKFNNNNAHDWLAGIDSRVLLIIHDTWIPVIQCTVRSNCYILFTAQMCMRSALLRISLDRMDLSWVCSKPSD